MPIPNDAANVAGVCRPLIMATLQTYDVGRVYNLRLTGKDGEQIMPAQPILIVRKATEEEYVDCVSDGKGEEVHPMLKIWGVNFYEIATD